MQQDQFIKKYRYEKTFKTISRFHIMLIYNVIQPFKLKSLKLFGIAGTPYFP